MVSIRLKKSLGILLAFVMTMGMVLAVPGSKIYGADNTITIYHTNDTHGRVAPDESNQGMIGIDKIAKIKEDTPNALLVDAGDTFHGLPIATTTKGENIVKLMNAAGYDVMTPGNHDFNYGANRLLELTKMANFDVISSNINNESNNSGFLPATAVKTVNGIKIGFIGISTQDTKYKTNPLNVQGLNFGQSYDDYKSSVQKAIDSLKEEKVDILIGLSHVGREQSTKLAQDFKDDFTAIIDGHDHLNQVDTVGKVTVTSTGDLEQNLGKLVITLGENNSIQNVSATVIPKEDFDSVSGKTEVTQLISQQMQTLSKELDQTIGKSAFTFSSLRGDKNTKGVRNAEMPLGDLVADSMRDAANANMALTNGGSLRADIEEGDISKRDILSILPFGNYLVVKEITPAKLKEALEIGVSQIPEVAGCFPQISGFFFEYNPTAEVGSRIVKIGVYSSDGSLKALDLKDDTTKYTLVTNDFIAVGGDNYEMMKTLPTVAEYGAADVVLEEYVTRNSPINKGTGLRIVEALDTAPVTDTEDTASINFKDIANHWSKDAVAYVVSNGIFSGLTNDAFGPDESMTRGMFVTVLGRMSQYAPPETTEASFQDVKSDAYYAPYIVWAVDNGIANGVSEASFEPDRPITREEAMVLITNKAKIDGKAETSDKTLLKNYSDGNKVSTWAQQAAAFNIQNGYISGSDGKLNPQENITRAEAASVLQRYISK